MQSSRKRRPAENVDDYIAAAPKEMRKVLKDLRRVIKETAPKAEERISYQIPAYKYKGPVAFFAAFKTHMSLYMPGATIKKFRGKLKPYLVSGATIRFTVDNPLPASLVKRMVRARVKENELSAKQKK